MAELPRGKRALPTFGQRQASIMNLLWSHAALTPGEIHEALNKTERLAYTTVHTELSRLLQKRLVRRGEDARYSATLSREEYGQRQISDVLANLIDAHGEAAIHGFVDLISNDQEHLDLLRERLRRRKGQ